jgi:hypothetical protein
MPIIDVGNNQTGLNADTSYQGLNGTILVPFGGTLPVGMPLARNLLAYAGSYLSQYAAVPGLAGFANGDSFVRLDVSGVQAASTGAASYSGGIYTGQPQQNPWLTSAGTLNATPLNVEAIVARTGLRPALCYSLNGGTAVKVGDFVGKGPTAGTTSALPFLISAGGATLVNGNTYGQVAATPIYTTLGAAVGPGSGLVANVWNTNGMTTSTALIINPGGANQETVTPTAVTSTAPSIAALTVSGTLGAPGVAQITFNVSGYAGSTGLTGPTGTNVTTFSLSIPLTNGNSATQSATQILNALLASGFTYGAPQNILNIGAGNFSQTNGTPATGALIYVTQAAGVLTFSAAMPGTWATTLLTYTITVTGGGTQTFNTSATGSATAVAFASGVQGTFTSTLANAHVAGEPVIGIQNASQGVIVPIPGTAGMVNVGLCYVDLITA